MTHDKSAVKNPRVTTIREGTVLYRLHRIEREALWFGPAPGESPLYRFDDPKREFRICYTGESVDAAFAESFLREPPVHVVSRAVLASRRLSHVAIGRDLKVAALYGRGLAAAGITAAVTTGLYGPAQELSRRIWERDPSVDGIAYASKHDNAKLCVALFDRCRVALSVVREESLLDDTRRLGALLNRYAVALIA